jgi:uncharacterized protein YhbP (UPF0306 family)
MAPSKLFEALSEYLGLSTLSLATADPEGRPHAAPVYFVADDDLRLYYFSDDASRHARDTAAAESAAAAIYPECYGWQEIRGLQLEGAVQAVPAGAQWEKVWELYRAKFPFVGELRQVVERNTLYVFTPYWLRLVDNRRGFGFKQEWVLP